MDALKTILGRNGIRFEENFPLSAASSFRIGGPAALAAFPDTAERMAETLRLLDEREIPRIVIGNGSNVLFPDEGYAGCVVFTGQMKELTRRENGFHTAAGVSLSALCAAAREASLTGVEFACGIPGSVGGAVFMNAGAYGGSMEGITVCSEYYDAKTGTLGTWKGAEQAFGNRTSIYAREPRYTVLGAEIRLSEGEKDRIAETMRALLERRRQSQPLEYPSAGSVFKRPEGFFAGKLIEDCGLKGTRVGGAEVSQKHAGFIVNRGGATARDVRTLIERIRERVLAETGVTLECEIRIYH